MTYSRVVSTGSYLPKRVVTNDELAQTVDTSDEWIVERTGISQRHVAADDETGSSMAIEAAKRAMADAPFDASEIDCIIVGCCTSGQLFPSVACKVQEALGIPECICFDVAAACAGFIFALETVDTYIKAGKVRKAIVIGSELMTRVLNYEDRTTCVLFGDGAGAVVLEASDEMGIHSTHCHADGSYASILNATGFQKDVVNPLVHMEGREVFKLAVNKMGNLVEEVLEANNLEKADIDWLIPHQANSRIIASIAKKLDMPMSRVVQTVKHHANTSSASVPLALDHGVRSGQIRRGDKLLLEAFGSGLAWGAALITY